MNASVCNPNIPATRYSTDLGKLSTVIITVVIVPRSTVHRNQTELTHLGHNRVVDTDRLGARIPSTEHFTLLTFPYTAVRPSSSPRYPVPSSGFLGLGLSRDLPRHQLRPIHQRATASHISRRPRAVLGNTRDRLLAIEETNLAPPDSALPIRSIRSLCTDRNTSPSHPPFRRHRVFPHLISFFLHIFLLLS